MKTLSFSSPRGPSGPLERGSSVATFLMCALATVFDLSAQQPQPATQNPSPMTESTREHRRLAPTPLDGVTRSFTGPNGRAVEVFLPTDTWRGDSFDLLVHFHGAAFVANQASAAAAVQPVVAVVNLGAGSGVYHRAFAATAEFDSLLAGVTRAVSSEVGKPKTPGRIMLTGFSAGHGAIRAILLDRRHFDRVVGVALMDGLHTSYVPEGRVLADSGTLDTTNLVALRDFARSATRSEKTFIVTHSEIFPGTFASTTETADWLLQSLGLTRTPVLKWGPVGMQQLSEVREGGFWLLGFAGNTAPDHIDHLHAMPEIVRQLIRQVFRP